MCLGVPSDHVVCDPPEQAAAADDGREQPPERHAEIRERLERVLGGLRAAGQLIAYELPLVLATVGVVVQAGTMSGMAIADTPRFDLDKLRGRRY